MPFFTQFFIISADYSFCKFFLMTLPGVCQFIIICYLLSDKNAFSTEQPSK